MKDPEEEKIEIVELSEDEKPKSEQLADSLENILLNTKDSTSSFQQDDIYKNRNTATMCYVPFIAIFKLLGIKKNDSLYLKYHINQGIILTIYWILIIVACRYLPKIFMVKDLFNTYTPGWVEFICYILVVSGIAESMFGLINTYNSKSKELPIIGKYKIIK